MMHPATHLSTLWFTLQFLANNADAFWRMPCGQPFITARLDPVVSPGQISSHVHAINGASGLDYAVTFDQLRASNCTTCAVQEDKSLYWTPQLYYVDQSGQYSTVGVSGMTVYYLQRGSQPVKAMPEGLRMVAGDNFRRTYDDTDFAQRAVGWSCIGGNGYTKDLRKITNCPYGLRAEIFFPNCWDGVNLDSPDHKSHVVYSGNDGNGKCPTSHPVKLVSVFMEQLYSVDPFKNKWWNGITPPFVLANGDPTGYALHADLISGWRKDFLQAAVDQCNNNSGRIEDCPLFDIRGDIANKCRASTPGLQKFTLKTNENIFGPRATLPGCNPIQYGPERAVPGVCAADGTTPSELLTQPNPVGFNAAQSSVAAAASATSSKSASPASADNVAALPVALANAAPNTVSAPTGNAAAVPSVDGAAVASVAQVASSPVNSISPSAGIAGLAAVGTTVVTQSQVVTITTTILGLPTALTSTLFVTTTLGGQAWPTAQAGVASSDNVVVQVPAILAAAAPTAAQTIVTVGADGASTITIRTTVTARASASVDLAALASEAIERARATMGVQADYNAVAASLANPGGVWTTLTRTEYETATITVAGQVVATQQAYVQLYVLPMTAASLLPASETPEAVATVVATVVGQAQTRTIVQTVMQTMVVSGASRNGTLK